MYEDELGYKSYAYSSNILRRQQKFEKIAHFVLTLLLLLLGNFEKRWDIFPNFVAFSQYLNFKIRSLVIMQIKKTTHRI
jgi:hypothetical protein